MNLIIVGAGHIGACPTELALKDGHNVTLIEMDEQRAREAKAEGLIGEGLLIVLLKRDTKTLSLPVPTGSRPVII